MDTRFVICILGLAITYEMDAAHTSTSHESTEMDTVHFYYDADLHYFIVSTKGTCYMTPLTHDERDHVHTNAGIEDLELTMMRDWLGVLPETRIYHDDDHLPTSITRWCGHKDLFLLERTLNETSTPVSPLASNSP